MRQRLLYLNIYQVNSQPFLALGWQFRCASLPPVKETLCGKQSARIAMDTWNRLSQITALRFVARSANESGWNGSGDGSVVVAQPNANTITFTETGKWQSDAGQQLNFNNVFRWSLDDSSNAIRLEHLRFGPDNPVYLFDLAPENDHTWQSATPHVCRDDLYSAIMTLAADQIELRWSIKGPNKDEDIYYWYS